MKRIIIIFSITFISLSAVAQRAVRIGSYEIIVRSQDQDTTFQINVLDDPCPPCPDDAPRPTPPRPRFSRYSTSTPWGGVGFILPDNSDNYYTALGGSSFTLDFGGMNRTYFTRWSALGWTYNYSFYNYRLRDAFEEPNFNNNVLGGKIFDKDEIKRNGFSSHNAAVGVFMRCYLVPQTRRGMRDGLYVDLGVQGDLALIKNYKIKYENGGSNKYNNDYAFNSFTASAVARVGWRNHAFFARYRVTELFNKKELPMDLPPISFGIIWLN